MHGMMLDNSVCNGYFDWLSGSTGAGLAGWADRPDGFVQILNEFALNAWQALTDPETPRSGRENLQRWDQEDAARVRKNPYGYLPGLAARLSLRGSEKLLQRMNDKGLTGAELRMTFLREYEQLAVGSFNRDFFGRYLLELNERLEGCPEEELQFRAKCSAVAFASDPPLVLGNIFNPTIGQPGNPSGLANERIMMGLNAWMEAHVGEISTLDPSRPLLPQFDRLTDEQMRSAFRSMDPWSTIF